MKSKEKLKEFRALSDSELTKRVLGSAEELMRTRFRKAGGQLEQSHRIAVIRQERAQMLTVLSERKK